MDWSWLLLGLAALLVAAGVVGTVVPPLPGPLLVLAGLLLAGWAEGFAYLGSGAIAGLLGLTALTFAVDFAATALGARKLGASRRAALGAVLGGLVGIFFAPLGLLVGPFLGAVLAELTLHRDLDRAGRAGLGASLGVLLGAAGKLSLVFAMIALYAWCRLV